MSKPRAGWDREIPQYRTTRAIRPSAATRHATEPPWSMCSDDDCWQYGSKPIAEHEKIETTSWPHNSFQPLNESARRIRDFFLTREKARMPRSPWLGDRIHPELARAMLAEPPASQH